MLITKKIHFSSSDNYVQKLSMTQSFEKLGLAQEGSLLRAWSSDLNILNIKRLVSSIDQSEAGKRITQVTWYHITERKE